ncbi:MAG: DUF1015 family protein [Kiritimatiellia bacterium]|nr:DUF1015 family protein [Kiritimatiellia bacterium]MDP6809465.1 DUF1015 family protein [Kiritimatiellia bacterium]MDP7023858.1 DUF1015 family protein [Kiritimatiellia bacterium]
MKVRAFRGVHPTADVAAQVASVPYDVVNAEEAREMAAGNPHSFLHVVRAEIDLAEDADHYSSEVYQQSARALARMRADGVLVQDQDRQLYVYELTMGDHAQCGVVACCAVSDYDDGTIKRHEQTREEKLRDRVTLVDTLGANSGPVFLTYRDSAGVDALVAQARATEPLISLERENGNRHTIWTVPVPADMEAAFARVPAAYIADGHHRAAAAAEVAKLRRDRNPEMDNAGSDWFLTVLFPASQMRIMPYNRVVHDLNGRTSAEFLEALSGVGDVSSGSAEVPETRGSVGIYIEGQWHRLTWHEGVVDPSDEVGRLDVSVLQSRVLEPVLGIADPRRDERIAFVGGIRGIGELERLVDGGEAAVAFAMHPVEVEDLIAVSDAERLMPPKSTWFEPKLLSGLLVHVF